ncbi:SDR family NAD(P)-dependent oxidoreductase [Streptomyces sp. NPDC088147]|uniref:SDR family NAD(P)-dependent oxidoreductase n=1 Tax=Streptomyces sp. NPDC088147 TaxID=3365830 RepID=UPI00380693A9
MPLRCRTRWLGTSSTRSSASTRTPEGTRARAAVSVGQRSSRPRLRRGRQREWRVLPGASARRRRGVRARCARCGGGAGAVFEALEFGGSRPSRGEPAARQAGYLEEITPARMRWQIETNLFGPMNVTRAALPTLRKQRVGHIITLSSSAGLIGQEFCVAYLASKFGVEGWMESLRYDVEPYNIHTTVVEPGFFRTELLVDDSTIWPEPTIDDYAERTTATVAAWKSMNGRQTGDPAKLARALLTIAGQSKPPQRFVAGADAIEGVTAKAQELLAQAEASRELGGNLGDDDTHA